MKILIDFNSIKVQLKLQISIPLYVSDILFQFHKGTIKTVVVVSMTTSSVNISIP